MLYTVLVVILILVLIGALPQWGHVSTYHLSGGAGLVLLVILILLLTGRL